MISEPETMVRTGWIQPTTLTAAGSSATSSWASRTAAAAGGLPRIEPATGEADLTPVGAQ